MIGVIRARRGERIVLTEYPKGYLDQMNERLDELADLSDLEPDDHNQKGITS